MSVYGRIMVAVENSPYDTAVLEHVRPLARMCGSTVVLIHVADGWVARNADQLALRESEEMRLDREYLAMRIHEFEADGIHAEAVLAGGDAGKEIVAAAEREKCDLIAMATHGHGLIKDVLYGTVVWTVRHKTQIPVLLVRGSDRPADKG
jgi:nucleotide-binding universal stress UspA family protein